MDFLTVLAQLNDLPSTFTRNGAPYSQQIDAIGSALSQFTLGDDATFGQIMTFANAVDGWLDVWGLLFGVPRNQNEANSTYSARIQATVLAWVGTVPAIQVWLNLFAPGGTIVENTGLGYLITLPSFMTAAQIKAFLISLGRIRPAGVPFTLKQAGSGLFLGTETFMGEGRVVGVYLTDGLASIGLPIGATTLSSQPLLPTLYFADPTLNPSLAPT